MLCYATIVIRHKTYHTNNQHPFKHIHNVEIRDIVILFAAYETGRHADVQFASTKGFNCTPRAIKINQNQSC